MSLAFELVEDDQKTTLAQEIEGLTGSRRILKEREPNRLARKELESQGLDLLSPEERERLDVSASKATSWLLILIGSAVVALDPLLELTIR